MMPPQPCQWCGKMSVNALHADLLKEEEKEQYCLAYANSTICITRNADSQRVRAETAESQIKTLLVNRSLEIANQNLYVKSLEDQLAFAERIRQELHELTTQITGKTPEKQTHGLNYIRSIRHHWDNLKSKLDRLSEAETLAHDAAFDMELNAGSLRQILSEISAVIEDARKGGG